jgi:L-fucose isomerase-like protein
MYLPLGTFAPPITLGLVSASRNCFPRALSQQRTEALLAACARAGVKPLVPAGECAVIESRAQALEAASQLTAAGCDAAVLFLGNFSPEIEDAQFVKSFAGPVMVIAAAEESAATLATDRGDALCGLLSAALALGKRQLLGRVYLPPEPVVDAASGAAEVVRFAAIVRTVKGIRNATIGLFGPRPRDFETCNYNLASIASLGVEVEELGLFDLHNQAARMRAKDDVAGTVASMRRDVGNIPAGDFAARLAAYEQALTHFRDTLRLSGATTQCWSEQELAQGHVPCFINARLASMGFPIACENDAYSLVAELIGQYASAASVTILDLNHSIPTDLDASLGRYPARDLVGMFHCGNTDPHRLQQPQMKHQLIMKRMMEPEGEPDITRGTLEGKISAAPITVLQVHGAGDRLRAYIAQGEFLDLDPGTFGCTGTAYLPGFGRFYRHALLGRFHHHAAVAFAHCGDVVFEAMKLLGIDEIHAPLPAGQTYPGENPFIV